MQPMSYNIQDTYFRREFFKDCVGTYMAVFVSRINGAAAHKSVKQESLPLEKEWCQGVKTWQMSVSKALDFSVQ